MLSRYTYLSGWVIVTILSLLPVVFWSAMTPLQFRFSSLSSSLISFAQLTGLVGMSMFALTLIMSARIAAFEDYFGGMNKVYVAHHIFGGTSFILLMLHPLFSALTRALIISPKAGALLFIPGADWSINFGIIALGIMMVLLILTFFIKLRYFIWKLWHQFLGVAFLFGGLHVFLIDSDVTVSALLRYYVLGLGVLGLLAYCYRTVFGRYLVKKYRYKVTGVKSAGGKVTQIDLAPIGKPMNYFPGQFMFISFNNSVTGTEVHPFSISSSPLDNTLRLSAKSLGDFTSALPYIKVGDSALIEGPYGRFLGPGKKSGPQIWIAGGIGITPFLSMARTFRNGTYPVDLFYVVHDISEAVYSEELLTIAKNNPKFRVTLYETVSKGRISAETIKATLGEIQNRDIFICGPPLLMKSMRTQFRTLGVKSEMIHTEEFTLQ